MSELNFPVDEAAVLLEQLPETLEIVDTHQLYGIWVHSDPSKGQKGGWMQSAGHVATWSPKQKALDFSGGLGPQFEVRPIFLVTPKKA